LETITETILNDEETIALRFSKACDFNFWKQKLKIEQKALSGLDKQANKIFKSKRAKIKAVTSRPVLQTSYLLSDMFSANSITRSLANFCGK